MNKFKVQSSYKPRGDQPSAIAKLSDGFNKYDQQTLLGVTGSGKTYTMAKMIEKVQKPTLIISHNKTLAAQLYEEFKEFFPNNKVCYFISYYDYYQPESYLPASDTYIEKQTTVNSKIEQYRIDATTSVVSRNDVIVIASVSCIYGLGDPNEFKDLIFELKEGQEYNREELIKQFLAMRFERNDQVLEPGNFRVRGETIDIALGTGESIIRLEFLGKNLNKIKELDFLNQKLKHHHLQYFLYPASPFVLTESSLKQALSSIEKELENHLATKGKEMNEVERYRLEKRVKYDLEMIKELGYCPGIENYSRHFDQRKAGEPPQTLLDFFPDDFLMILDESHVTVPQLNGMYNGDRARKQNLVDYGFRLPSALDNRPLKFKEFEKYLKHAIYVSATPAEYELENSKQIVEQIIRPTGLVDPQIEIRPIKGQMDDLIQELSQTFKNGDRALITTLTKQMAEDLTEYFIEKGIKAAYLHSEIKALERMALIRDLRLGKYDVIVGINLLREGLDIPEVAFIGIMDADKEGFLRNERSLIQTIGRAARNIRGKVVLYADKKTKSIKNAIKETDRRRNIQLKYNQENNITPQTIIKKIDFKLAPAQVKKLKEKLKLRQGKNIHDIIVQLETEMKKAAEELDFEKAIELRDELRELKKI